MNARRSMALEMQRTQSKAVLKSLLAEASDLSAMSAESLSYSYSLPVTDVIAMLMAERRRREIAA